MASYTWTKMRCATCGNVERVRGLHGNGTLGSDTGMCYVCHGRTLATEIHWGPEKYARTRGKAQGQIDKAPKS